MIVNKIAPINVNNKPKSQNSKHIYSNNVRMFSEPKYAPANVLQAQSLFRLSNVNNKNGVSFQGLVLKPNLFKDVAAVEGHPNWQQLIARAEKLYPKGKNSSIVIDPHHRFGEPVIEDTNISAESIFSFYNAGESISTIASLYDISEKQVNDALDFFSIAA